MNFDLGISLDLFTFDENTNPFVGSLIVIQHSEILKNARIPANQDINTMFLQEIQSKMFGISD